MPRTRKPTEVEAADMPSVEMLAELATAPASQLPVVYDSSPRADIERVERNVHDQEYWDLVKRTVCKGATDTEFKLFQNQAIRTRLDPLSRQIYAIFRWDSSVQRKVMGIQVSIDGYRIIAERSHKYRGQEGPLFCSKAGNDWCDVWVPREGESLPFAAKVGVRRSDFDLTLWAVAPFSEYRQLDKDDCLTGMWAKMPALMLAKAAESLALRKAFPQDLSGLHTTEEMAQLDNEEIVVAPVRITEEQVKAIAAEPDVAEQYENRLEAESKKQEAEAVDADFQSSKADEPVKVEEPKKPRTRAAKTEEEPLELWTQKTKGDSTPLHRTALRDALTEIGVANMGEMLSLLGVESWNDISNETTFGELYNTIKEAKENQ